MIVLLMYYPLIDIGHFVLLSARPSGPHYLHPSSLPQSSKYNRESTNPDSQDASQIYSFV